MAHAEAIDGGFAIEPDDLARLELSIVRRGYDPDEVQALLASTAEEVRALREEREQLRRRLEEAEATQALEEARHEGQEMVDEARLVRRRILEDLARRRATMGRQIEQLRAGRDRLVEAFELIRQSIEEAGQELAVAMPQAQAAAARAGAEAPAVMDVEDLEEELEMARVAGLPIIQPPETAEELDDEPVEVGDEVLDDESDVEALFAKLRAETADDDPTPEAQAPPPVAEVQEEPAAEIPTSDAEEVEPPEVETREDETREDEPLDVVENALARRLKRVLADEQNAALERIRSRRARTLLGPDRILGGSASERLQRYELVVAPHLDEAAAIGGGADSAGLTTEIADRLVTAVHADVSAAVEAAGDDEELTRLVRACFRRLKTEEVGELAAEFVQAAAAPDGSS